jgi:hypothetical protein
VLGKVLFVSLGWGERRVKGVGVEGTVYEEGLLFLNEIKIFHLKLNIYYVNK